MCGIIGYTGHKRALPILLEGLRSLEYRGYDSAGVAIVEHSKLVIDTRNDTVVDRLRRSAYPELARFANVWQERLGLSNRFPPDLDRFLAACAAAGPCGIVLEGEDVDDLALGELKPDGERCAERADESDGQMMSPSFSTMRLHKP